MILLVSRKTKKQKILAEQKRQAILVNQPPSFEPKTTFEKTSQNLSIYSYPTHLVRKDLTKTVLLCILAISLEIALYFILEKNLILSSVNF
jgi:hypothetical protein